LADEVTIVQEAGVQGIKAKFDWTKPVLYLFAAVLIGLIVMPLSWLAI
jgi:iron(III) transport system permease protein